MRTNVLKKIQVGNPLINLGLTKLYDEYQSSNGNEQIASFYHRALTLCYGSSVATTLIFGMISFSTDVDSNPLFEEMMKDTDEANIILYR